VAALVTLTVALEISQGVARYYADAENDGEKVRYASSAFWFTGAAYVTFGAIAIIAATPINRFLFETTQWVYVWRLAVGAMAANGTFYLLQDLLRWQLKPQKYGIASLSYTLTSATIAAYLILFLKVGIIGIYLGQIAGAIVGGALAWSFSRQIYSFHFDLAKWREMVAFSLPLVPSSVAVFFSLYIDRMAIRYFMTLSDVGLYGIGFRFASVVLLFIIGVRASLTPLIYRHYKAAGTPMEIARIFRFFFVPALLLFIALSIYSKEIILLLTPPIYYAAWSVIPILSLSVLLSSLYIFAPGLAIAKKTRIIAGINLSAALINAVLNFMLIPLFGIVGAAAATCTASFLCFSIQMYFSQRLYRIPHQWKRLLMSMSIALAGIAIGLMIGRQTGDIEAQNVLSKLILLAGASLAIFFTILNRKEMASVIKRLGLKPA
jgi:O-antigen/teichoic acid export membrane protein